MTNIKKTKFTKRCLYRIILEAETPIAIGSGEKDLLSDSTVTLDVNGLPYIPATSIAGVVRHAISNDRAVEFMGFQQRNDGKGSNIIFTEGKLVDADGSVHDGLYDVEENGTDFIKEYLNLPIRQHVRINAKGGTDKGGKFDNQVVFAGSRFCFEMELLLTNERDCSFAKEVVGITCSNTFRLGGSTRNGLGKVKVVSCKSCYLDLENHDDLTLYLKKSSNLGESAGWNGWKDEEYHVTETGFKTYRLELSPNDFFLFGSGFGDNDADIKPVVETKMTWNKGIGRASHNLTLIPATSVKGALSHRTAYHYNKLSGKYAGNPEAKTAGQNIAVQELFGYEDQQEKVQRRGSLLFSDLIIEQLESKILPHVMIDRFTGGTIEGALFAEAPLYGESTKFVLDIILTKEIKDEKILLAFENSLDDLCNGLLPLGGGVNRGNGIFTGKRINTDSEI